MGEDVREVAALLATLGAQQAAANQRLDALAEQVGGIRTLLTDKDGLLMRVDRLESWQKMSIEEQRNLRESASRLKDRLFYPLLLTALAALGGLGWALLTHQAALVHP